jgi:hypothetical protein
MSTGYIDSIEYFWEWFVWYEIEYLYGFEVYADLFC